MTPDPGATAREIERILHERFAPAHLEVIDESLRHAGHAGSSEGGHYRVVVVSAAFEGLGPVDRHRLVNCALEGLFAGKIHALALRTFTPDEASRYGRPA